MAVVAACKSEPAGEQGSAVRPAKRAAPQAATPAAAKQPVPPGSPFVERAVMRFAIYFTPRATRDARAELARLVARELHPPLPIDPEPAVGSHLRMTSPAIADFAPPDPHQLEYFGRGLTAEQVAAVQKSQEVVLLEFVAEGAGRHAIHRGAMTIMHDLALRCGGLLWDEDTRELFTPDVWAKRMHRWEREVPFAPDLFTIHSYKNGDLVRLVTLGLGKLGLPDLVVEEVAPTSTRSMASLINLVAQTMADGAVVRDGGLIEVDSTSVPDKAGGPAFPGAHATIALVVGTRDEGDADNRLWEIAFPGGPASELQERQDALLSQLFGTRDELTQVEHDEEMLSLSRRARAKLLKDIKKQFQKPAWSELNHLMVKAPFRTDDGGNEWMWMDVVRWQGTTIEGILQNDPAAVSGLKSGARVTAEEESIFDYMLERRDGTSEGNTTGALMQRRQNGQ